MKYRVFISSVQSEFARERKSLAKYIREDALLGDFFEVFLFEEQPAKNRTAKSVFLEEVAACDVYLGLFGSKYGSRDEDGVSPTEREYDRATGRSSRMSLVGTNGRMPLSVERWTQNSAEMHSLTLMGCVLACTRRWSVTLRSLTRFRTLLLTSRFPEASQ